MSFTVDDLMRWLDDTLGIRVPTLPLPAGWGRTLTKLWRMVVANPPPPPPPQKPWRFDVEGEWQVFESCRARLSGLVVKVWSVGGPPPEGAPEPLAPPPRRARARAAAVPGTNKKKKATRKSDGRFSNR